MRGKIDTILGCSGVVGNQPVSFDGSTNGKPVWLWRLNQVKTILASVVAKEGVWLTSF